MISTVRGLAAAEVAVHHLRNQFFPDFKLVLHPNIAFKILVFLTGFAHQAVVLFFVISGWLVGGSLLRRFGQRDAVKNYAIDRVSRLWTVLIPALFLTLACGAISGELWSERPDPHAVPVFSPLAFVGNLFGLQTWKFYGATFPIYGNNFPLWSLANETWYYAVFPLVLCAARSGRTAARVSSAAALLICGLGMPHLILIYFSLWLLGAFLSAVAIPRDGKLSRPALAAFALVLVYCRVTNSNDSLVADLLCGGMFLVFLASLREQQPPAWVTGGWLERAAKSMADFSFSLYVVHIPLIGVASYLLLTRFGQRQLLQDNLWHWAAFAFMVGALLTFGWLFYFLFESRTTIVRDYLKQHRWIRSGVPRPTTSSFT